MAGCAGRGGSHHPTACRLPQIAVQNPLVSERLELSVLYKEYAEDDNVYQQKIKVGIRQGGGDGPAACQAWGWALSSETMSHSTSAGASMASPVSLCGSAWRLPVVVCL